MIGRSVQSVARWDSSENPGRQLATRRISRGTQRQGGKREANEEAVDGDTSAVLPTSVTSEESHIRVAIDISDLTDVVVGMGGSNGCV